MDVGAMITYRNGALIPTIGNTYLFYSNKLKIKTQDWFTPNTYGENYKKVPETSGVYLLTNLDLFTYNQNILYVGRAQNLKQRYGRHEVKRFLEEMYGNIMFYFKETQNYKEEEIKLIRSIKPQFNRQHNG